MSVVSFHHLSAFPEGSSIPSSVMSILLLHSILVRGWMMNNIKNSSFNPAVVAAVAAADARQAATLIRHIPVL